MQWAQGLKRLNQIIKKVPNTFYHYSQTSMHKYDKHEDNEVNQEKYNYEELKIDRNHCKCGPTLKAREKL